MKIIKVIKEMTKDEFYRRLAKILFPGYHLSKTPAIGLTRRRRTSPEIMQAVKDAVLAETYRVAGE